MRTGIIGVASSSGSGPGAPGVPLSLAASVTGPLEITCTWSAPTSNGGSIITTYEIDYSTNDGGSWTSGTSVSHPTTTKVFTGLTSSSVYVFRVRAQNVIGYGPYTSKSNSVEAVAPTVTGGTLTSDSTYYYRTFTSSGTLSISAASLDFDYAMCSGGEGGNGYNAPLLTSMTTNTAVGGRGALVSQGNVVNALGSISIVVGAGGAGGTRSYDGDPGPNGTYGTASSIGATSAVTDNTTYADGASVSLPTGLAQPTARRVNGGGAGSSANGVDASATPGEMGGYVYGGDGGAGTTVFGVTLGGGGGAASMDLTAYGYTYTGVQGAGGSGGGGTGGLNTTTNPTNGTANTGGGGGGGINVTAATGGSGGSGIVIIRYLKSDVGG